jgi:predicted secreted protein
MIKDTEMFAEWLHNNYESLSEQQGWITKKECQVNFKDLPSRNKAVMISLAERIKIQFHMFFDKIIDETKSINKSKVIQTTCDVIKLRIKEELRG